jgi:hypothetical protein
MQHMAAHRVHMRGVRARVDKAQLAGLGAQFAQRALGADGEGVMLIVAADAGAGSDGEGLGGGGGGAGAGRAGGGRGASPSACSSTVPSPGPGSSATSRGATPPRASQPEDEMGMLPRCVARRLARASMLSWPHVCAVASSCGVRLLGGGQCTASRRRREDTPHVGSGSWA